MLRFKVLVLLSAVFAIVGAVWHWMAHYEAERAFMALAKNIYYEAALAGEPEEALHLPAITALNRARINHSYWGGTNVHSVVYQCKVAASSGRKVCQYSWVLEQGENSREPTFDTRNPRHAAWERQQWEASKRIARQHLDGEYKAPSRFEEVTSYMNTEVTRRKWRHNVCAFKTTLVYVGKMHPNSKHDVFREPLKHELKSLPTEDDVEECKPLKSQNVKKEAKKKVMAKA